MPFDKWSYAMNLDTRTNPAQADAFGTLQKLLRDDAQSKFEVTRQQALQDQEFFAIQASTSAATHS
jgi:hypothetical protein